MWTFPLLSIFLSFILWKDKISRSALLFLAGGLSLQIFSYASMPDFFTQVRSDLFILFGKGLLLGVLLFNFGFYIDHPKGKELTFKLTLLTGFIALSFGNFFSEKIGDMVVVLGLILFPAVYWRKILNMSMAKSFSFFAIAVVSFFSFIFKWSYLVKDQFNLTPLLWMLSFAFAFYLVGSNEDHS